MSRPARITGGLVAILVAALAAGCGFHLRGSAELPAAMATTHLRMADPATPFARDLARRLTANGVTLIDEAAGAGAILEVPVTRVRRRALSVSGNARVREYRLDLDVAFRVTTPDGDVLVPRQELSLGREYSFDEQEILAATREEEFLREQLYRAMADQVLRRLEAAAR